MIIAECLDLVRKQILAWEANKLRLYTPKKWDGLTITRLPMGHAVSVTPMQVHAAMSAVANDGILMKPRFVSRVFDEYGKTVVNFDPNPVRRVVSANVARNMSQMLVDVVSNEGTARQAIIPGFKVAGKTGTAKKLLEVDIQIGTMLHRSPAIFPADDPKILITIVVDEPKMNKGRLGYGGSVAGPSFRKIGQQIISYMGLEPSSTKDDLSVNRRNINLSEESDRRRFE